MKQAILIFSILLISSCGNNSGYNELIELGEQAELNGNFQEAADHYKQAIKIDPSKPKPYSLLAGSIAQNCADCGSDTVLTLLNKAYELDSLDELTIFNLAYVNGRILNNYGKSIDYYSKLIELTTNLDTIAMIKANRANMFMRSGDTSSYCSDLKAALEQIEHEQLRNNYLIDCHEYIETDVSLKVLLDSNNRVDTIIQE
ncbi:MAG: tetratricopeptide repeat protein [Cyclobacteriaceae bacterium]